jgi:hypothetical protein
MSFARRLMFGLAIACLFLLLIFGIWIAVSPGRDNASGPLYVLWKAGAFPFDSSVVYPSMVGDIHRDALVVGLDVSELERRFGRLRTRAEATPDYQKHYSDRFYLDKEIRWLDDSPWLVILENGRAKELHLMKG